MFDVVNSFTVVTYDVFPFPVAGALGEGSHKGPRFLPVSVLGVNVKSPSAAPSR